ncbi:MAG: hypothetical protein EXS05_09260 [Planctomycetaceae bacterium]|nr:hypothetical protein [Planctomycetaceae bacterium]
MKRFVVMHFLKCAVSLLLFLVAAFALVAADDAKPAEGAAGESAIQAEARNLIQSIRLEVVSPSNRTPARLIDQPRLRFGDVPRDNEKGSVWIWESAGRPAAILELYKGSNGRQWVHVIQSLSEESLEADVGDAHPHWAPQKAGIEWRDFPGAPAPAERPNVRLRQMKDLAQQFAAHEFWDPDETRYELRLLVQPIHKYSQPDEGLLDGAVFVFTHGTNPEVALLVEAIHKSEAKAGYRYALARLGHAEMHASLADREVWVLPRVKGDSSPDSHYWLFFKPEAASAGKAAP